LLTHLLPPHHILAPNTIHVPPTFCVCAWYKKQKKPPKNKILYGSAIQYSIGHIIL
jgi:hypothetical protein